MAGTLSHPYQILLRKDEGRMAVDQQRRPKELEGSPPCFHQEGKARHEELMGSQNQIEIFLHDL